MDFLLISLLASPLLLVVATLWMLIDACSIYGRQAESGDAIDNASKKRDGNIK